MASDDKYGRLRDLVNTGKEKGYVLYEEVSDLLPEELATSPEIDDLLEDFESAGVQMTAERFATLVAPLGRQLVQRTTDYGRAD